MKKYLDAPTLSEQEYEEWQILENRYQDAFATEVRDECPATRMATEMACLDVERFEEAHGMLGKTAPRR